MPALLDLLSPSRCAACGVPAPVPWCGRCRDQARALVHRAGCRRCAGWCPPRSPGCPLRAIGVSRTTAAFTYTGVVATTVVAAKVGGHRAAWAPLGDHLGHVVATRMEEVIDAVVPVATHPGRARRRGVDHAMVLARRVATALDVPVVAALRAGRRTPDRGRGRVHDELPDGAIRPARAVPPSVLLVDDVLTTGATVRAAVTALRAAGMHQVQVAVLARAGA